MWDPPPPGRGRLRLLEAAKKIIKEQYEWVEKQNLVSGFKASSRVEDMSLIDCAQVISHLARRVAECEELGRKACKELDQACRLDECPSAHKSCNERSDAIHLAWDALVSGL